MDQRANPVNFESEDEITPQVKKDKIKPKKSKTKSFQCCFKKFRRFLSKVMSRETLQKDLRLDLDKDFDYLRQTQENKHERINYLWGRLRAHVRAQKFIKVI